MSDDLSHPLHRASLYLDKLKYGDASGELTVTEQTAEEASAYLEMLLREAGLALDSRELLSALDFYAASFQRLFRIPRIVAKTIFADGVAHGIALAAGLEGDPS